MIIDLTYMELSLYNTVENIGLTHMELPREGMAVGDRTTEKTSPLKLFGTWASSYTHRVQLALKLKGLEFEYVEEDLSAKSPSLLLYNPVHQKVPVLLHGGRPLAESIVILQYIDETWREHPLMPEDPYERAVARFWCHFSDDKVSEKPSLSSSSCRCNSGV